MVFSIKQQLWQEVVPILQVWIFIPNIQQLKQFQNLFKILNLEEKKLVIWQMMQDNWCFDTKGSRIHQVCNLVEQSDYLTNLHHNEWYKIQFRYMGIMQQILRAFKKIGVLSPLHVRELMTELIQTSSSSVIPELVLVYNIIWKNMDIHTTKKVLSPVPITDDEKIDIRYSMYTNSRLFIREVIKLHDILNNECIMYLENKIDETLLLVQIEIDRLYSLIELAQVI